MTNQDYRVNVVKFLMTTFESMDGIPNFVAEFKRNCVSLIKQYQISQEEYELVLDIYGVTNTNTYKPTANGNKLMQIKMLMGVVEGRLSQGQGSLAKETINDMLKSGMITAGVKDVIYKLYGLETNTQKSAKSSEPTRSNVKFGGDLKLPPPPLPTPVAKVDDPCHRGTSGGYRSRC